MLRSSPILEYTPTALLIIAFVGSITAFFAASLALVTNDLKRTIAFSTISQIGYLMAAVGLSQYGVALFHLVNHAFFKALLFLSAGGILHSIMDEQDIRKLGSLVRFLPFTYVSILIGSLSLMAVPFLSGFYSKDLILELAYGGYSTAGSTVFFFGTLTAIMTAYYSFRLINITFFTKANAPKKSYESLHEQPGIVILPLVILAFFSIFFGYFAKDVFVGIGSDVFASSLFTHPNNILLIEAEFSIPTFIKLLPSFLTLIGTAVSILMFNNMVLVSYSLDFTFTRFGHFINHFLAKKYNFDGIVNHFVVLPALALAKLTSIIFDRGAVELAGPKGLTTSVNKSSYILQGADDGVSANYALYIMLFAMLFIGITFGPDFIGGGVTAGTGFFIVAAAALFSVFLPDTNAYAGVAVKHAKTNLTPLNFIV